MDDRPHRVTLAETVTDLETDIRHFVVDLEYAWDTRDWAELARLYRRIAAIADRLEKTDPDARSRVLARAALRDASLYEAESAELGESPFDDDREDADEDDDADERF